MTGLGKCCTCLDEAITANHGEINADALPDAVVLAPYLLNLGAGVLAVPLPMCVKHRSAQLSPGGKGRLVIP